ncbi:histidine kinase dimerization/phosphoacceptor domain -containing protein [Flaviflagellibacter deserti]|uniref:Histidine kinase dimerization/phosphoacceptor domain -containing protein n=1 Tax=Flaviflagellibacter deserti TaxID=2267266 RepID=A0ABV9Z5Y7_9HYPH
MSDAIDTTLCDREPIHIPGSIQPHGLLLVADLGGLVVRHGAGDIEGRLGRQKWLGASLVDLIGGEMADRAAGVASLDTSPGFLGRILLANVAFDVSAHLSHGQLVVELEPTPDQVTASAILSRLEAAAGALEKALTLNELCQVAALEFRRLTGYSRVMIYHFLENDAGVVLGEDRAPGQPSFMNHHFPASDIPKQARALYIRNLVRVIPDVSYEPAPLRPTLSPDETLDMSDCILRSVSSVHIQYLRNMGVAASASISIVKDGVLWGLVACHNETPLAISYDVRAASRALAGSLARQIKAREETDAYRERVRLRSFEDDIVSLLSREGSLDSAISNHLAELMRMLNADGVAVLRSQDLVVGGRCPPEEEVRAIGAWATDKAVETTFATERLSEVYPGKLEAAPLASGLLAITLSASEPWLVLWFRAEHIKTVEWAGNPQKDITTGPGGVLNPRASFEAWKETVRGRARRWTLPEVEAAGRLRVAVTGVWQNRRMRDLNRQLLATLDEKDVLIRQKEFLIGEVNHRVQNSLQLVSSFLSLQARASNDPALQSAIDEARRRLAAVSLVHRRLYRADQVEAVDVARYIEELTRDLVASMGDEWAPHITLDLSPVMLPPDRTVGLGLVLTELIINANKYAYGGQPGPLRITLAEDRADFRLTVADQGGGRAPNSNRRGFGSRMMDALVTQLGGDLGYEDAKPGLRAVLKAPISMQHETAPA